MRALWLAVGLSACGGSVTDEGGPRDDASSAETTGSDAFDLDASRPADAGPRCAPISGSSRFGVLVSGDVAFTDGTTGTAGALLLFPQGRVAGAPVSLVVPGYGAYGFGVATGVLDASLGAHLDARDLYCGNEVDGSLVGPDDGLSGTVKINVSAPSDALALRSGPAKLCAVETVSTDLVVTGPSVLTPLAGTTFQSNFPIDEVSAKNARVLADGVPVAVGTAVANGVLSVGPTVAFPPRAKAITFDLSNVRDALGRALPSLPATSIGVPGGAVLDRAFDAPPPSDAIYGVDTTTEGGALHLPATDPYGSTPDGYVAIVGLGSESGATKLRIKHRFECAPGEITATRTVILSADGRLAPLMPTCSDVFLDENVALPGEGPYYLYVEAREYHAGPCSYPGGGPSYGSYVLDEVQFVP